MTGGALWEKVPGYEVRFELPEGVVYCFAPRAGDVPTELEGLAGLTLEFCVGITEPMDEWGRLLQRAASEEMAKYRPGQPLDRPNAKVTITPIQTIVKQEPPE